MIKTTQNLANHYMECFSKRDDNNQENAYIMLFTMKWKKRKMIKSTQKVKCKFFMQLSQRK